MQPSTNDPGDTRAEARRLLVLAIGVACAVLVLHFTPLNQWIGELQALKDQIRAYGWKAYVAFTAGSIAAITMGFPRLALCALGGTLFGFVGGAAVGFVSSMAGSWGTFLAARWGGREWAERRIARASESLRSVLATPTIGAIFIARQLPVPGVLVNVLLGVLPTTQRAFLIGTGLAYLPSSAIVALAGSSLGKDNLAQAMTQITLAMLGLGVLTALVLWLRGRVLARAKDKPAALEAAAKSAAG